MATVRFEFVDGTAELVYVGGSRYRELLEEGHAPVGSVPESDGISDQLQAYLDGAYDKPRLPAYAAPRTNPYDPSGCAYNVKASNTRRLRADLGRARAGTGLCHLVAVGDSTTDAAAGGGALNHLGMWPLAARDQLGGAGFPLAGSGVVPSSGGGGGVEGLHPYWTVTGPWINTSGNYSRVGQAGATATFTSGVEGTQLDLWYMGTSGAFTITVDGGAPITPARSGSNIVNRHTITGLPDTTHTLVLTTGAADAVYLCGAAVTRASGLAVSNLAIFGSSATTTWQGIGNTTSATVRATMADNLAPASAVFTALGVNDIDGGATPADTRTAIEALLTRWPDTDHVLVLEAEPGPSIGAAWDAWASELYDLADAMDVPLLDFTARTGGNVEATANGLMGDTLHPNPAAQQDFGRMLANLLNG